MLISVSIVSVQDDLLTNMLRPALDSPNKPFPEHVLLASVNLNKRETSKWDTHSASAGRPRCSWSTPMAYAGSRVSSLAFPFNTI